jgi:hypothetical protein
MSEMALVWKDILTSLNKESWIEFQRLKEKVVVATL